MIEAERKLIRDGNVDAIQMLFGNVSNVLSRNIRGMFIASPGNKLIAADFSAIEARNLAYLAREKWKMDVFAGDGKIYEATAARMFNVPVETIVKGHENYALRQKGKICELALGYGGGVKAFDAMGGAKMGISEEEAQNLVALYREANKMTTSFWYECEYAAIDVVMTGVPKRVSKDRIEFALVEDNWQRFMTIRLPSGRHLYYALPSIDENRFGKQAVHYYEVNGTTKKWERTSTYGGKLVENITQAFARDCLAEALRRVWSKGWDVVFHVHDEIILDVPESVTVDEVCAVMCEPIPWAPGLVLKADGFESEYYKKG